MHVSVCVNVRVFVCVCGGGCVVCVRRCVGGGSRGVFKVMLIARDLQHAFL